MGMTVEELQELIRGPRPRYIFGLDLGQAQDYTALVILEAHGNGRQTVYHCRHIRRWELMTPYTRIVSDLALMLKRVPFSGNRPRLAVDGTGVGRAVVDMLWQADLNANLKAITIHSGLAVTHHGGGYGVPKRDLIGAAQVALQNRRLKIASELPEAETLTRELKDFRVKISASGRDTYGNMTTDDLDWRREGAQHDDLVLAVCCALWLDARPGVRSGTVIGV